MKKIMNCLLAVLISLSLISCGGSADTGEKVEIVNVVDLTLTEAKSKLEKLGFTNISVKDFDENWDENRYIVTEQDHPEGTEAGINEKITLTCAKKCYVYLTVASEANWIFSTYDIDFYVNGKKESTIKNGDSFKNLYTAIEGKYELKAVKHGDDSVSGTETIDIHDDMTYEYELSHTSTSITFKRVNKSSGVDASIIDEYLNAPAQQSASDETFSYEGYKDFTVGNYGIKVPENWEASDSACVSPDDKALVNMSENGDDEWTDADAEAALKYYMETLGEDTDVKYDTQSINEIKMWHAVYKTSTNDNHPVTGITYVFIDPETKKLEEVSFYQMDGSGVDCKEEFTKIINSIHRVENGAEEPAATDGSEEQAEPKETATPEPTPTPTPTPEPKKKKSLSYTTNDLETAKKGNTGVFAYADSGQYTNYYIIDFDEGYVYYFAEGNGNEICERLIIESGDLNEGVKITYHDGGDEWSYYLHFKRKNQPDRLILVDEIGYEYEYRYTDLDDALEIRDKKEMVDL